MGKANDIESVVKIKISPLDCFERWLTEHFSKIITLIFKLYFPSYMWSIGIIRPTPVLCFIVSGTVGCRCKWRKMVCLKNGIFEGCLSSSAREDMYAQDSIELLTTSGIQFKKHEEEGIETQYFAELLMTSGVVLCEGVKWLSFHR